MLSPPTPAAAPAKAPAADPAVVFDGAFHAAVAPLTGGLSPISLLLAQSDWALHLLTQPAQSLRLVLDAQRTAFERLLQALQPAPGAFAIPAGTSGRSRRWCAPISMPKPGGATRRPARHEHAPPAT
jgi:hypothetical protein